MCKDKEEARGRRELADATKRRKTKGERRKRRISGGERET